MSVDYAAKKPHLPPDLAALGWQMKESRHFPKHFYYYNTRSPQQGGFWKLAQVYCAIELSRRNKEKEVVQLMTTVRTVLQWICVVLVVLGLGLAFSASYLGSADKLNLVSVMGVVYGGYVVIVHTVLGAWFLDSLKALWSYVLSSVLILAYTVETMLMVAFDGVPSFYNGSLYWTETLDKWFHSATWDVLLPLLLSMLAALHLVSICLAARRIYVLRSLGYTWTGTEAEESLLKRRDTPGIDAEPQAGAPHATTVTGTSEQGQGDDGPEGQQQLKHFYVQMFEEDGGALSDEDAASAGTLDSAKMSDFDGFRTTTRANSVRSGRSSRRR